MIGEEYFTKDAARRMLSNRLIQRNAEPQEAYDAVARLFESIKDEGKPEGRKAALQELRTSVQYRIGGDDGHQRTEWEKGYLHAAESILDEIERKLAALDKKQEG